MALLSNRPKASEVPSLTLSEIDFLLRHLSKSQFDGKDVLVLHSVVQKLQKHLEQE